MKSILEEAATLVADRRASYGEPLDHWTRTIGMINALFGANFAPEDWALMMSCDKLARERGPVPERDNTIDIAGYLHGRDQIIETRKPGPTSSDLENPLLCTQAEVAVIHRAITDLLVEHFTHPVQISLPRSRVSSKGPELLKLFGIPVRIDPLLGRNRFALQLPRPRGRVFFSLDGSTLS